jgi:hypothetical protein
MAVTSPLPNTVATAEFDELHVTVAPLIVAPFWSLTVADRWDVAPSEAKFRLVAERVIDVATGVGVGVDAVRLLSPPQLPKKNRALNTTVFEIRVRNLDHLLHAIFANSGGIIRVGDQKPVPDYEGDVKTPYRLGKIDYQEGLSDVFCHSSGPRSSDRHCFCCVGRRSPV